MKLEHLNVQLCTNQELKAIEGGNRFKRLYTALERLVTKIGVADAVNDFVDGFKEGFKECGC